MVKASFWNAYLDRDFQKYFGASWLTARAICTAESGLKNSTSPPNSDGSIDRGICQINDKAQRNLYSSISQLYNIDFNIEVAAEIYHDWGNFNAWTTYKDKAYLQYL